MDKPRIAVIAVHGVGDHQPGATSAAIAEQLQQFGPGRFESFECTPLRIAVDADELRIAPAPDGTPTKGRRALPQSVAARARGATSEEAGGEGTDIAFTEITLAGGEHYADSYVTTRMRSGEQGKDGIDLYEMFWSDLSHGGTKGGLNNLRQMMQLFLHVASLGRTALSTLVAKRGAQAPDTVLSSVYGASAWGYWLLAVPIALGNLLLVCLGAAFLAFLVPDSGPGRVGTTIAAAVLVAGAAGAAFQRLVRKEHAGKMLQRAGLPLIWLAAISISLAGVAFQHQAWAVPAPTVAFMLALPVSLLLGSALVRRYEVSRPGAMSFWVVVLAAEAVWGVGAWYLMEARQHATGALEWFSLFIDGNFVWMASTWVVLGLVNLWLFAAGMLARLRLRGDDEVRRSVDTGFVAAAIPAPLLLIVVLTLWSAVWHMLNAGHFALMDVRVGTLFADGQTSVSNRIAQLIELSASPAAIPFLLCMTLALACAVVAFLPSILVELAPPGKPNDLARSRGLWRWLDQGFGLLHWAKWIAVGAFFLLLPAGIWLQYLAKSGALPHPAVPELDLSHLGVALGGSALGFLSLTRLFRATSLNKLSRVASRLGVLVDTAVDVDNWLRERPVGQTPRLHIMARYASLLRYLHEQGYGRIVVVSHSQGTVITLDLLRYLEARNAEFLRGLAPIDLLTFGTPVRQLYACRFPALYGWAEKADHRQAGLASWQNGYGSGDYVGRNLWDPNKDEPWLPGPVNQREFCTGALSHTHYFDEHSPAVAAAISAAIANASVALRPVKTGT